MKISRHASVAGMAALIIIIISTAGFHVIRGQDEEALIMPEEWRRFSTPEVAKSVPNKPQWRDQVRIGAPIYNAPLDSRVRISANIPDSIKGTQKYSSK